MCTSRVGSRTDRAIDATLWGAGLLSAGITLAYSLVVAPPQSDAFTVSDKALHFAAYFATSLCLLLAAVWRPGRGDGPFPTWGLRGAMGLVAAGALIELVQGAFTARQPELIDVVADLLGVGAALLLHGLMRKVTPVRR
jgi:VanZ family protein